MKLFHPSVEGAQHSPKGLDGFLNFAKEAGAAGCQPSNFMLEDGIGGFRPAAEIRRKFADIGLKLDGVSAHCPFWVHTTAWTGSKAIRPFLPQDVQKCSLDSGQVERWAENYILRLLDLCAELKVKIVPMFWGVAFGWEVATGYPWGFWSGPGYDLIAEGKERFVKSTAKIRAHAKSLGIILAHEIHPGTAAMCADDFLALVKICDDDPSMGVNIDPSHCWEGESWEARFSKVAKLCYGCHVKNHVIRPGFPLRCVASNWQDRAMQFTDLATGDINMARFIEMVIKTGYAANYLRVMGDSTAPLVVEAESAYRDLDATSADGIRFVRDNLCFPAAESSFEDGMGADK